LREQGLAAPVVGGSTTFLQAKTANEVLKAQERRLKLQKLKGELVSLDRAKTLLFRLAREERDAWVNWPGRVAAILSAELGVDTATMHQLLESQVRTHLGELADVRTDFR
jgi:DNA transposition AAA+ family ATPase